MSFLIKDHELLEKYDEIWRKSEQQHQKKGVIVSLYNKIYLETNIKSYKVKN